jgi:hypothetical protein
MRSWAVVVLAAMPLLLGAWTLSDNGVPHWDPKGKAVVKTPGGVLHVIRSSNCSFGQHGWVRLRFGGKLAGLSATTDMPYMNLVARMREGDPAVLDIIDGVLKFPPEWGDANHFGTVHVQVARRRGTFALFNEPDDVGTGKPRYTGSWKCG